MTENYKSSEEQAAEQFERTAFQLDYLTDDEFIAESKKFAEFYRNLLTSHDTPPPQIMDAVNDLQLDNFHDTHADEQSLTIVNAYRHNMQSVYESHNLDSPVRGDLSDTEAIELAVRGTEYHGAFSVPVVFYEGAVDKTLLEDSPSFCAAEVMIENQQLPIAFIHDKQGEEQKKQALDHELSHANWALLRRVEVIPAPDGETISQVGSKSTFELARDEAVAQMAAGQNKFSHPSVVNRLRRNGDDAIAARYMDVSTVFNQRTLNGSDVDFSDGILAVASSANFEQLFARIERLAGIAETAQGLADDAVQVEPRDDQVTSSWDAL